MPFSMPCMSCRKTQDPLLDPTSNEVYCGLCGAVVPNVSHFAKVQMKALGQIRRPQKSAYAIRCNSCKKEAMPKLVNNVLICSWCNAKCTTISKPFEALIRDAIKKGFSNDID